MAMNNFKVEVNSESRIMGAGLLAAAALWTLGATVAEEAKAKAPVIKATAKQYAEMGRAAADEKAAGILTGLAAKLQAAADNMKQQ